MIIGYCRVSTLDQNTDLQMDALTKAGCEKTFTDHASGAKTDRPQLKAALDHLRPGDVLVVWKLDRLGRSTQHLLEIAADLDSRGVQLFITSDGLDTRTATGRLTFVVLGAIAEFERALIVERTKAGLAAARARGMKGGRKAALTPRQAAMARQMYNEVGPDGRRRYTVAEIARQLQPPKRGKDGVERPGMARSTVYRYLRCEESTTVE